MATQREIDDKVLRFFGAVADGGATAAAIAYVVDQIPAVKAAFPRKDQGREREDER